ncbi:YitT family protein [Oricola thermophila]|uniref:YitT family protein n=1 Tax=Oricola thermophila TaxID=2742145 RepID=A0A6N1VDI4_9HYPH|nr:YitT family protein [Oricola thermophila]QKV18583.1 YitT family protein [Oricola thermophila]
MQKEPEATPEPTAERDLKGIDPTRSRHSLAEDIFALVVGTSLVAFGVFLYQQASLVLGGLAGVALILDYLTPFDFGAIFFAINLPFYLFGIGSLGWRYILRTFAAVTLMSAMIRLLPSGISIVEIHPLVASIAGGAMIGLGLLALFRHGAGLGGVNILVAFLQERLGLRAGYVQLGIDLMILAAGALVVSPTELAWSVAGAVVFNMILGVNHKPGRYMAFS